jgi:hypothetical protein
MPCLAFKTVVYLPVFTMLVLTVSTHSQQPPGNNAVTPTVCQSGYYLPTGMYFCMPCPYGTATSGGTVCVPCPVNTHASKPSAAGSCTPCPTGRFTEHSGTGGIQDCRCGVGYYWAVYTPFARTGCVICNPGKFNRDGVDVHSCQSCPTGSVTQSNGMGTSCQQCPPGETTTGTVNTCYCTPPTTRTSNATGCSSAPETSVLGPTESTSTPAGVEDSTESIVFSAGRRVRVLYHPMVWLVVSIAILGRVW